MNARKEAPPADMGKKAEKKGPRVDRLGDPLPPGAFNRLGSQRFRNSDRVANLAYSPDGKAIASACADGSVRLWEAATGKLRRRLETDKEINVQGLPLILGLQHALAFSRDGKKLAMLNAFEYVVIDAGTVKVLVRQRLPAPQKGLAKGTSTCAIAPDLATFALGLEDGTIELHDAASGKENLHFTAGEKNQREFPVLRGGSLEFSADGKTIYALSFIKSSVMVFDTTTGKLKDTLKIDDPPTNRPGSMRLATMTLSRDSQQLAITGTVMGKNPPEARQIFWDLPAGKPRHVVSVPRAFNGGAFSPDGKFFAGPAARDIVFFNTATGKDERRMPLPASAFTLAFAPDGSTLAAGDLANITLLNVATGKVQAPVPEPKGTPFATQFRAGGKQLISFGTDGVYWWDLAGGQIVRHFQYEQPGPRPLLGHVLSPDEKVIVTSGSGGDLELVDVAANKQLHTLKGHKFPRSAAFSPDGSRLYSAGNGRVIVWDVQNGKQLLEWESPNVANLAVSPDGRWVAYWTSDRIGNSFARNKPPEGTYDIRLWDVGAGKLARRLTLRGGAALDAVFSADSTRLVIVGGDPGQHGFSSSTLGKSNVLQIWDVATGTEVRTFRGNQERAICVAISPDAAHDCHRQMGFYPRRCRYRLCAAPVGCSHRNGAAARSWDTKVAFNR